MSNLPLVALWDFTVMAAGYGQDRKHGFNGSLWFAHSTDVPLQNRVTLTLSPTSWPRACEHCGRDIRYFEAHARFGGKLFHALCLATAMDVPATRLEDWELEARRHEDTLQGATNAAHAYHIERRA